MENSDVSLAVIYLLSFRLAVLLLSGLCVFLGYKLFYKAMPDNSASSGEVGAKFGEASLSIKNAAPGIVFSAFGALVAISVLSASPPTVVLGAKSEVSTEQTSASAVGHRAVKEENTVVRGGGADLPETPEELLKEGAALVSLGVSYLKRAREIDPENEEVDAMFEKLRGL